MKLSLRNTHNGLVPIDEKGREWKGGLQLGAIVDANFPDESAGTVPMLRTWYKWMDETAREMARRGCTMPLFVDSRGRTRGSRPFKKEDAHDLFTSMYLGVDEQGRRKSWTMSDNENEVQASMEDRLWAMDRHLEWCAERGIKLTIPRNSEYQKHREAQAA